MENNSLSKANKIIILIFILAIISFAIYKIADSSPGYLEEWIYSSSAISAILSIIFYIIFRKKNTLFKIGLIYFIICISFYAFMLVQNINDKQTYKEYYAWNQKSHGYYVKRKIESSQRVMNIFIPQIIIIVSAFVISKRKK